MDGPEIHSTICSSIDGRGGDEECLDVNAVLMDFYDVPLIRNWPALEYHYQWTGNPPHDQEHHGEVIKPLVDLGRKEA